MIGIGSKAFFFSPTKNYFILVKDVKNDSEFSSFSTEVDEDDSTNFNEVSVTL